MNCPLLGRAAERSSGTWRGSIFCLLGGLGSTENRPPSFQKLLVLDLLGNGESRG